MSAAVYNRLSIYGIEQAVGAIKFHEKKWAPGEMWSGWQLPILTLFTEP